MHLMYYLDKNGKRVYTLEVEQFRWVCQLMSPLTLVLFSPQKIGPDGKPTNSAHPGEWYRWSRDPTDNNSVVWTIPATSNLQLSNLQLSNLPVARFSPDDKFSRQRVILKKRFGLLPTQQRELHSWIFFTFPSPHFYLPLFGVHVCYIQSHSQDPTQHFSVCIVQILDKGTRTS